MIDIAATANIAFRDCELALLGMVFSHEGVAKVSCDLIVFWRI